MIRGITAKNFKRIGEVAADLQRVTIVVGANNSGKTSILQAVHFAAAVAQSARLLTSAEWLNEEYQTSLPIADLLYLPGDSPIGLFGDPARPIEVVFQADTSTCKVSVELSPGARAKVHMHGRALGEQLQALVPPFTMYAPGLAGVTRREEALSMGALRRIVAGGDANRVLRNILYHLSRDASAWPRFGDSMSEVFPGIHFRIRFNEDSDQHIGAEFRLGEDGWLPLDTAGNGILQAAQVIAYTELFVPQLLVLDEPDSHLHPENQRRLCRLLADLSVERDVQVLVATHSRHVLDSPSRGVGLVWLKSGAVTPHRVADIAPVLLDIGALDAIDYVTANQPRCVVATEDADTELLRMLLASSGFNMEQTYVFPYSGCTQVASASVLAGYLRERVPTSQLIVHRDRDFMTDAEAADLVKSIEKSGMRLWMTKRNDLEHYLLDDEHLRETTQLAASRIKEILTEARTQTRDGSIKAIINQRTNRADRLKRRGVSVDYGSIAVEAMKDYDGDPERMCHGKLVLGQVRQLLNRDLGKHPAVMQASQHLAVPELADMAREIWSMSLEPPAASESH